MLEWVGALVYWGGTDGVEEDIMMLGGVIPHGVVWETLVGFQ